MDKPRKRTAEILSACLTIAVCFSGCSVSRNLVFDAVEEKKEQIELDFFGFKYENLNVMAIEDALHGFMDKYPDVTIAYEGIKGSSYYDVLEKRMSTGNGDDIFMVDHARAQELSAQGKLLPLDDISTLGQFSDLAKSQMTTGENITYLPTSISAFGLYCNLSLLEKYGRQVPTNFAEFRSVCDFFVSQGIVPVIANNDISLKTVAISKGMYPVYQGEDPTRQLQRFNSGEADFGEALRPGFELVQEMIDKGYIDCEEALNTLKTQDDLTLFAQGTRPFMLTGVWAAPRLRELNSSLDFSVVPYPILEDGSVLVINLDTRISVNADSPHKKEAKAFVEYLTQKDVMWEFVNSQSSFSPLKETRLAEDKAIQSIGPYINNGRSVLGSDDILQFPVWDMTKACVNVMLKGGDAAAATASLKEQLNAWRENTL